MKLQGILNWWGSGTTDKQGGASNLIHMQENAIFKCRLKTFFLQGSVVSSSKQCLKVLQLSVLLGSVGEAAALHISGANKGTLPKCW